MRTVGRTKRNVTTTQSKRRWFQYSLRTLLILLVFVTVGCFWYVDYRRLATARADYRYAAANYEVAMIGVLDLSRASRVLAEVEDQSWFVGAVRARAAHLIRASEIEKKYRAFIALALFGEGGREEAGKNLDQVVAYRAEAEEWLKGSLGQSDE